VDAETGKEVWRTKVGEINKGETMTMAPLVVKGKVLVGNSGGEFGVRGWLKALSADDGKVAWTAYSSGPDADCLIGDQFKPFYASDSGKDLGVKTWPAEHWKIGGGTVWGWISYVRDITPVAPGAKDWQPSSYSPRTGYLYVPHQHLAMDWESVEANYIAGTPYLGANVKMYADPLEKDGNRGEFMAWDPIGQKKVWGIKEKFPVWSGTCVTAGDVTFYGTMEGWFKAVHARSGEVLWQFKTGSGIIGQPVTYKGPEGKQYVAVLSGVGGWAGAIVAGGLDSGDPTAALGFVGAMKDLPQHTTKRGTLYVFSLP
jgi:glucose dehydrogenase